MTEQPPGAQTERSGAARPVSALLGGMTSPAAFSLLPIAMGRMPPFRRGGAGGTLTQDMTTTFAACRFRRTSDGYDHQSHLCSRCLPTQKPITLAEGTQVELTLTMPPEGTQLKYITKEDHDTPCRQNHRHLAGDNKITGDGYSPLLHSRLCSSVTTQSVAGRAAGTVFDRRCHFSSALAMKSVIALASRPGLTFTFL
jgi:hypothetical protein